MRIFALLYVAGAICFWHAPVHAAEGSSVAGPIGGTDIRSAQLPPPGLYGGLAFLYAKASNFYDGSGKVIEAFDGLDLTRKRAGAFLLFVPDMRVLGGSVSLGGFVPVGNECGRLFATTSSRCINGLGDPYVEIGWSRFFGTMHPSQYPGAYPVAQGLTVGLGLGAVIPIGKYDAVDAASQGLTIGNNVWDIAPSAAVTYMTTPLFADGTELSAKVYVNNYIKNPATGYYTGSIVSVDFAVSERIGNLQLGLAGVYARQVADDKHFGKRVEPDGRRGEALGLGPVLAYDFPEHGAFLKAKALASVRVRNSVDSIALSIGVAKRF